MKCTEPFELWVDYDEKADVLYISFERPQKATDSRVRDGRGQHRTLPNRPGTTSMPNPFFFGGHITNPDRFVGRKTELRRIASLTLQDRA